MMVLLPRYFLIRAPTNILTLPPRGSAQHAMYPIMKIVSCSFIENTFQNKSLEEILLMLSRTRGLFMLPHGTRLPELQM